MTRPSTPLVRHAYFWVKRGGGAPGYLYYLQQAIERFGCADARVEVRALKRQGRRSSLPRRVLRRLVRPLLGEGAYPLRQVAGHADWVRGLLDLALLKWQDYLDTLTDRDSIRELLECDLVVAHEVCIAERIIQLFPQAADKVCLVFHGPTYIAREFVSGLFPYMPEEKLYRDAFIESLCRRELEVMRAIRAVIWPCPEAQEGFPEWCELVRAGKGRSAFAETGTDRLVPQAEPAELRRRWGVPASERAILYMGRPHPHKGWTWFLRLADWYRRQGLSGWQFLFAGQEPHWAFDLTPVRLLGFVRDNGAALLAADLVVVPNEYTFMDLGVLEAMSLGARLAVRATGGNKHLLRVCPALGHIPEGPPEVAWPALEAIASDFAASPDRSAALTKTWESRFSLEPFLRNHEQAALSIVERSP